MELGKELYQQIRADAGIEQFEIDGRKYTSRALVPVKQPEAATLEVTTLTAIVDYLKRNIDVLPLERLICQVTGPRRVDIRSAFYGDFRQRETIMSATTNKIQYDFDAWFSSETFNIKLQSYFVSTPDLVTILRYVGNIKEKTVKTTGDDGITQSITVKNGIASIENVILPNPVTLRPYRTFNEVEQPESLFVFRARQGIQGPEFALFEADNGAWKSVAMLSIKAYLEEHFPELHVIA